MTLNTPLSESKVRSLKCGDTVSISGIIFTARDLIHKYLYNEKPQKTDMPFDLDDSILYHCGPLIKGGANGYSFISGGPTTSERLEMYEWWVIKEYGIRAIIGKGGMGDKTINALKENGCVYLQTISGAAVYLADRVKKVLDVWKLDEYGVTEAMWKIEVKDFPATVTMDSLGNSLHKDIKAYSVQKAKEIIYNQH